MRPLTFLRTAAIDTRSDSGHAKAVIDKAITALNTIRHFATRVEDMAARTEIDGLADKLEAAINNSLGGFE